MYNAVQASRREKHAPLNSYISLYEDMAETEEDGAMELVNVIASNIENKS